MTDAALSAHDGSYGDDVVRIGGVADAEQKPHANHCKQIYHLGGRGRTGTISPPLNYTGPLRPSLSTAVFGRHSGVPSSSPKSWYRLSTSCWEITPSSLRKSARLTTGRSGRRST